MLLSNEEKSVYYVLLNSTRMQKSINYTLKQSGVDKKFSDVQREIFIKFNELVKKIDKDEFTEQEIIRSIDDLSRQFRITFGQAQKGINVLLKYYYYLSLKGNKDYIKDILHCPLDSTVLNELEIKKSLKDIDKEEYISIQEQISRRIHSRIDFDKIYEEKYLRDKGIYDI